MAKNIKGIIVEIGGDATGLGKALKQVDNEVSKTSKELKQVERLLKLDPKNTELLAQKQMLLSKNLETTKNKLTDLKAAQKKLDENMKNGVDVNQENYRKLQREIVWTERDLKALESQTNKFAQTGEKIGSVGNKMTEIGKKGMAMSAAIVGGAVAATETTREYREDISRLEAAFVTSNKTAAQAKDIYNEFYKILGESDRSVEAVNHLAKLCNSEQELAQWSTICAGVSATFGDSLPIEGLTEAANETAKVAKVTGPLADALNWAGISEDGFNAALEKCNGEKERSALITNTLASTYQNAANEFNTLNAEVIKNREATQKMNDAIAQLGAVLEPIITAIVSKLAELFSWFTSLDETTQKVLVIIAAVTAGIPPLILLIGNLCTSINAITMACMQYEIKMKTAAAASTAFNSALAALPYVAVAAGIALVIGKLLLYKTASEKITDAHNDAMKAIDDTARSEMVEAEKAQYLRTRLYELEDQIKSGTLSEGEAVAAKTEHANIANQLNNIIPGIISNIGTETNGYATQRGEVDALTKSFYELAYAKAMANAYQAKIEQTAKDLIEIKAEKEKYAPTGEALISAAPKESWIQRIVTGFNSKKVLNESKQLTKKEKELENKIKGYNAKLGEWQSKIKAMVGGTVDHSNDIIAGGNNKNTKSIKDATKAQSAAVEKACEKELRDLKYQHEMGIKSDAEYYSALEKYRDDYCTEGSKEWQTYTTEIHNYTETLKKEVQSAYDEVAEKALSKIEEIESAQKTLADKLKNYGTLYTIKTDTYKGIGENGTDVSHQYLELNDLSKANAQLTRYRDVLNKIRDKGVPQGFFSIMRDLSVDEGIMFAEELLSIPDTEFNSYIDSWKENQRLSEDISKDMYRTEVSELRDEISGQFENFSDDFLGFGMTSADEWCKGFLQKIDAMREKMQQAMSDAFLGSDNMGFLENVRGLTAGSSTVTNSDWQKLIKNINVNITNNGNTATASQQRVQTTKMFNQLALAGVL